MGQSIKPDPEEVLKQVQSDLAEIGEVPEWQRVLELCLKLLGLISALLVVAKMLENLFAPGNFILFYV
jgi:hypothetical protein